MKKAYGRKTREKVTRILGGNNRPQALTELTTIPDEQLVGHLFHHFYTGDELLKFRAATAMGELGLRLASRQMERARVLLRRLMWNLNDESGGIGWGSPEAMGQILNRSQDLAAEFKSILFSYLDEGGNYIEHEILQRGVIWGIGTYLKVAPRDLPPTTKTMLFQHLESSDPVKRGYACRALIHGNAFDCQYVPQALYRDANEIPIFTGWNFVESRISDMVHACRIPPQVAL